MFHDSDNGSISKILAARNLSSRWVILPDPLEKHQIGEEEENKIDWKDTIKWEVDTPYKEVTGEQEYP
jgi:hypothetical protein